MPETPATPDFYSYRWEPLAEATINPADPDFVELSWADGVGLSAYKLWLKENAVATGGFDPATREGLVDPAEHDPASRIESVAVGGDGSLIVRFGPDGTEAAYHPGWLRHVADGAHRAQAWLPEPQSWRAADLVEPPTHDASGFPPPGGGMTGGPDETAAILGPWVDDLVRYGLARLRNLSVGLDTCLQVAEAIGAPRDTNFGRTWDVKADITMAGVADTNSTANTNLRLGPHTDLPTRETPPGFQFLACYANEAEGGYSTMADGQAIVECLKVSHPDHYEALTTLNWVFFNRGPGIDHRWSGPFIDLGTGNTPLTLRAFYPVRAFPDMDPADMPRAYEAMSVFSSMAASSEFQIAYPFEPGDLVGFDNRRILHGRDAFTAGGYRHLRGVYIDHDEIYSYCRVHNRKTSLQPNLETVQ